VAHTPLFRAGASAAFRAWLLVGLFLLLALASGAFAFYHSQWWSRVGLAPSQPVLFSHRHHAQELRIDCRYCHSSVETSPFAGMPSTQTCLSCHSQIFTDTAMLRPVIASAEENRPLRWARVTRIPDFVYFDHRLHVARGVACAACHGPVQDMALTAKGERLDMRQCLDCHRHPAPYLPAGTAAAKTLTDCTACHR